MSPFWSETKLNSLRDHEKESSAEVQLVRNTFYLIRDEKGNDNIQSEGLWPKISKISG